MAHSRRLEEANASTADELLAEAETEAEAAPGEGAVGRRLFGASGQSCSCVTEPPSPPPPPCFGAIAAVLGDVSFPSGTTTLDTAQAPWGFNYTSLTIPAGAVVTATGTYPLRIFVSGTATIEGTLSTDGGDGDNAIDYSYGAGGGAGGGALLLAAQTLTISGTVSSDGGDGGDAQATNGNQGGQSAGVGIAGGGDGGDGGAQNQAGVAGTGPGAGQGGKQEGGWPGGGTGGGYGQAGSPCSGGACVASGGVAYSDSQLGSGLVGGSGGGGGGNDGDNEEGPGGGGSGGTIWIKAGTLDVSGTIRAAGGVKGTNTGSPQAGNGAVGRIRLDFNSRTGGDPQTQFYGHQTDQCAITLTGPA